MSSEANTTQTLSHNIYAIQQIFEAIKEFEKTQRELRAYGANDTEPDGVFQNLLWRAVCGEQPEIPRSELAWDLYTNSMDCEQAANKLYDAAKVVVDLIEACPVRHLKALQYRLKYYCWRLNM